MTPRQEVRRGVAHAAWWGFGLTLTAILLLEVALRVILR